MKKVSPKKTKKPAQKKSIADEFSGMFSEEKLRALNDERTNYILDKGKKQF